MPTESSLISMIRKNVAILLICKIYHAKTYKYYHLISRLFPKSQQNGMWMNHGSRKMYIVQHCSSGC